MNRALYTSVTLAVLFSGASAHATAIPAPKYLSPERHWFAHTGSNNSDSVPQVLPIVVHFDNSNQDNLSNADAIDSVKSAFAQWTSIACTNLSVDTTLPPDAANHVSFNANGKVVISFNDPGGDLGGLTLAATTTPYNAADQETLNGHTWRRITDFDIVWATGWSWVNRSQIGSCTSQSDLQSVAVHEIGHGLGYAHSCEDGESCGDPELRNSIMYWQEGPCQILTADAWDNNMDSISYGIGATSDFTSDVTSGGLPLAVTFSPLTIGSASIQSAAWTFGDGSTDTATNPLHSYAGEGRYSVDMKLTATSPLCGSAPFTQDVRKVDYITACNILDPKFHFSTSGKTVHFFSDTVGSAVGCLQSLQWDFGDGKTGNTRDPIHTYDAGGKYTVKLVAVGPAGATAPLSKDISTGGGSKGCSVDGALDGNMAAAIGSLGAALAMCLVTVARRKNGAR